MTDLQQPMIPPPGNGMDLLRAVASAYFGVLIQKEHIKNKALDDMNHTHRNNIQQNMERIDQRLRAKYEIGESPNSACRQLGVTPYPQPAVSESVVINEASKSEKETGPNESSQPEEPEKTDTQEEGEPKSEGSTDGGNSGLPTWQKAAIGLLAASAIGGNAGFIYQLTRPDPEPEIVNIDSGMGSVGITVES